MPFLAVALFGAYGLAGVFGMVAVMYALADVTGIFRDAGLSVTSRACDPWTEVLHDLESGATDVALGGLWVPGMSAGSSRALTVIGQLNHTCPKVIVRREAHPDFALADLAGQVVLAPGAGGSGPYAVTAGLMREAGVDPDRVDFVRDLSTSMLVELFVAELGDAIVLDLVTAVELESAGHGHVVYRNLEHGGLMPNSVYYCRTDRVEELRDRLTRFVAGVATAMNRLPDTPAETIDGILRTRWPGKDLAVLRQAVAQMSAGRVWERPSRSTPPPATGGCACSPRTRCSPASPPTTSSPTTAS
ncbi:MAG TPA: ABC transporter substrate-binding protein [Actinomycetospora sp.]|jgi:NitT/TauT family transport system substrate-binding protein|uniref:ABC transporter substrate-binding protein n=1 Tax=Actinomycetospora sp. TaxID=1872135 RepID=UPI002F40F49C